MRPERMSKEIIVLVCLLIAIGVTGYYINEKIYTTLHQFDGCTKDAKDLEFPIGTMVFSPRFSMYGTVDSLRDDCSVLGINWDNSRISQQGVSDYIKVTNKTYYIANGTPSENPCAKPKSEAVAKACIPIMENRFMNATDIFEGTHKGCGGFIKIYPQNFPAKYLVGCTLCGDYYNTDNPPLIEGDGTIS